MDIVSWILVAKMTRAEGLETGIGATTAITGFASESACKKAHQKIRSHTDAIDYLTEKGSFKSSTCIPSALPVQTGGWTQLYMWSSNTFLKSALGGPGSITGYVSEEACKNESLLRFKDNKIDWSLCSNLHD